MRITHLLIGSAAALAASAQAAPIAVANASFEQGVAIADGGSFNGEGVAGWSLPASTLGRANTDATRFPTREATDGTYVGYIAGAASAAPSRNDGFTFSQLLPATLAANTRYTLSVDVGDSLRTEFAGYAIGFVAGAIGPNPTVLASTSGVDFVSGDWLTQSVMFETGAAHVDIGKALSIYMRTTIGAFGTFSFFDNVRVDATPIAPVEAPAPAAFALFGLGLATLLRARRRRAA